MRVRRKIHENGVILLQESIFFCISYNIYFPSFPKRDLKAWEFCPSFTTSSVTVKKCTISNFRHFPCGLFSLFSASVVSGEGNTATVLWDQIPASIFLPSCASESHVSSHTHPAILKENTAFAPSTTNWGTLWASSVCGQFLVHHHSEAFDWCRAQNYYLINIYSCSGIPYKISREIWP